MPRGCQLVELRLPSRDDRPSLRAGAGRGRPDGGFGRDRRLQLPGADQVVQREGRRQRRDAQLPVEQPHQGAVGAQRPGAVAAPGGDPDQVGVGRFGERVDPGPAPGVVEGGGEVPGGDGGGRHPAEQLGELVAERVGGGQLPVLEGGAVAHREAGQETVAGQRHGPSPVVRGVAGGQSLELGHVAVDQLGVERDAVAGDPQRRPGGGRHRERPAQGRAGAGALQVGPQQRSQRVPAVLASGHGQQRQQGGRLAGVEPDGASVPLHLRRAEQRELQGHHRPPRGRTST